MEGGGLGCWNQKHTAAVGGEHAELPSLSRGDTWVGSPVIPCSLFQLCELVWGLVRGQQPSPQGRVVEKEQSS